jgi:hypothetical protein
MEPMMAGVIGEEHFAVEFEVLELVDLDADVVHDAQAADAFAEFFFFELMGRPGHDVDFNAALLGADQALDDDGILIALVLNEEGVLGIVDKLGDAVAAVVIAPDEEGAAVHVERFSLPIAFKASDDFLDLVGVGCDDGVIASVGEIFLGSS